VRNRYERGAMILTSNRGFAEWGEVCGDPVVATALLDRLLHHAVVIQIEGSVIAYASTPISCRRRSFQGHHQHANPGTAAAPSRSADEERSSRSR
jgi:hypothetical protein